MSKARSYRAREDGEEDGSQRKERPNEREDGGHDRRCNEQTYSKDTDASERGEDQHDLLASRRWDERADESQRGEQCWRIDDRMR